MNITDTLQSIENNEFTKVFSELYGITKPISH